MSFAEAAEQHLDDVYGYLAWFTGDRGVAEELTAETFERALRLWHRFDPKRGSVRTWLCQLARTVALAGSAARVLGISPTNCTTRLNRALRKLEEALHVAA